MKILKGLAIALALLTTGFGGGNFGSLGIVGKSFSFAVLDSDGNEFTVPRTVLDSDGNEFVVPSQVKDSDGNDSNAL